MRFKPVAAVLMASFFVTATAQAQSERLAARVTAPRAEGSDTASPSVTIIKERPAPRTEETTLSFILRRMGDQAKAEFHKAWWIAGAGIKPVEGVVLLYRGRNGSLIARSLGCTNERSSFSFKWEPTIIGVVHTHPNESGATPEGEDLRLADRFHVPIFTITNRGMFVYDPATKKSRKVLDGLEWLNPSRLLNDVPTLEQESELSDRREPQVRSRLRPSTLEKPVP